MKRLYLETNFIVGQAFSQDSIAASILDNAAEVGADVCIPAICIQEALSTVEWRGGDMNKFGAALKGKLNELKDDKSPTASKLIASLNQALIENGRLVNERQLRISAIFRSLLRFRFAHVDPEMANRAISAPVMDGAADNLILHAIEADAVANPCSDMAFFTLDAHFAAEATRSFLKNANVLLVSESGSVLAWLRPFQA